MPLYALYEMVGKVVVRTDLPVKYYSVQYVCITYIQSETQQLIDGITMYYTLHCNKQRHVSAL